MGLRKSAFYCAILLVACAAAVNAAPTVEWTVDELIAPLSVSAGAGAVVVADEPGVADVVWRSSADADHYYTQFVNGIKTIDAETVVAGNTYSQLGISRSYDGKLRVGIRTAAATISPNFAEFTRDGVDDWSSSGPASPAEMAALLVIWELGRATVREVRRHLAP